MKLEWNRSAKATSELSCHSCKILPHWSPKQLLPLTNTSKLSQIQIKLLDMMNAEALKCFKILCFVACLHAYLFTRHFEANSWWKAVAHGWKQSLRGSQKRSLFLHFADRHDPARLIKLFKLFSCSICTLKEKLVGFEMIGWLPLTNVLCVHKIIYSQLAS